MKRTLSFLLILFISKLAFAGWVNLNTGINDNLTGVVFWGNSGLVSGHKGLYYTTTGGSGSSSWTRFNITGNYNDSLLYNHTKFLHAYSAPISTYGLNKAVACGLDTINNKPVVLLIDFAGFSYTVLYVGSSSNGGLNKITFNQQDNFYYIVGDNGQFMKFYYTGTGLTQIATSFTNSLNAVSFNTSNFCIGTNGNIINGTVSGGVYTYTNTSSPGNNFRDVVCLGLNYSYSVGSDYFKNVFSNVYKLSNYNFGPLNANSLIYYNNCHYVGTDHGIFKSSNTYNFLEWQPSSLNYNINNLWYSGSGNAVYACGANGVVLTTTDGGGAVKPVAKLNLNGGCAGTLITMGGMTGSSNDCKWYINGSLVFSLCGTNFQYSLAAGQYSVQLVVSNSYGLTDTAFQLMTVVDYPKINKPITLSKSLLCKQEALVMSVDSSQLDVFYSLKRHGSSDAFGSSINGNGSTISFTTLPVSQSGDYYIQASSALAWCDNDFTDTLKITVEHTKANFHTATLNAPIGENIINYQNCTDAQNYLWSFNGGSPSILTSSIATPTIFYNTAAPNTIKLICWSNNGCYDSIQKSGPNIFVSPSVQDSCWVLVNNAPDPAWIGHYDFDLAQLSPSKTGFLACGTYYHESFASRFGDSLRLTSSGGAYVGKYDFNGVLKWMNYTKQPDYNTSPGWNTRDVITSVKEDAKSNVYICGRASNYFYDNRGDSILLQENHSSFYDNIYFISKLDSSGKFVWRLTGYGLFPNKLIIDKYSNLIVNSSLGGPNIVMELNGVPNFTMTNMTTPLCNKSISKIDSAGNILWYSKMVGGAVSDMGVDVSNNLYVTGGFQNDINLLQAGSSAFSSFGTNPNIQGNQIFLVKYDDLGNIIWKMRAFEKGPNNNAGAYAESMAVDSVGNVYITGSNENGANVPNTYKFIISNTDGTQDSTDQGRYFTMKINKNGVFKWINSTQNIFLAMGAAINLYKNELSCQGFLSNAMLHTGSFTSQNGTVTNFTMGASDYFIAIYDTLGNLNKIIRSGINPYNPQNPLRVGNSMFRSKNGEYYMGEGLRLFNGNLNYTTFNNTITNTNGLDGVITKFSGTSCGIIVPAGSTITCTTPTISVNSVSVCPGNTVSLTASGATSYSWSPNVGLGSSTGSVVSVSTNSTTTYSVIASNDVCMTQTNVTVYSVTNPSIAVNSSSICSGKSTTLTASGVNTYTWSTLSSNSTSVIVNPSSSTIYTVSGNISGCSDTYTAVSVVSVYPLPTVAVNSAIVCAGETATLYASGASSYVWASFSTTGPTCTFTPLSTKVYTVIGTSIMGCSQTITTNVVVTPNPTISITSSSSGLGICAGESVTLTATGASSYTWSNGVVNGVGFMPLATNLYTVIGSTNSCTAVDFVTVIVNSCAGIEENKNLNEFGLNLYPNPTKTLLFIDGLENKKIGIKIISSLGQTICPSIKDGVINVSDLSSGIYFILIYNDSRLFYQNKIIKE